MEETLGQESMTSVSTFPAARACPFSPPAEHAALRDEHGVFAVDLPSGQQAWLLTRHADVRRALESDRLSADMSRDNFPVLRPQAVDSPLKGTFMRQDGEPHMRVRRMLNREFTVRRAETMRPMIERITDARLAAMEASGAPVDLVQEYALPVPSIVICEVLGVPYEDHDVFQRRTRTMVDTHSTPDQVRSAAMELFQYLGELVARKEKEPGDDMISRFLADHVATGKLDKRELVTIAMLTLAGAHETTAAMISGGVLTLLRNPDQLADLRAHPELIGSAVEELLRYLTVAQVGTFRVAAADIEIGGRLIRAGDGVVADLPSANRDGDVFPDPDRLDIRRHARRHTAFSHGPHNCVGQSLARLELEIAYSRLLDRFPALELAVPESELTYRPHTVGLGGVEKLPVRW